MTGAWSLPLGCISSGGRFWPTLAKQSEGMALRAAENPLSLKSQRLADLPHTRDLFAVSLGNLFHDPARCSLREALSSLYSCELRIGAVTVKRFKWMAPNQETVLAAFEEEGWPHRIDDPLPPHPDQDSKRRLSDTIKCLNHKQKNELIRFHGDGTGEGVTWELVEQDGSIDAHSG